MPSSIVVPVYAVVDTSASMSSLVDDVSQALADFMVSMQVEPIVGDKARLTIMGFAEEAKVYLDFAEPLREPSLPKFIAGGPTYYGSMLRLLRRRIQLHRSKLRSSNHMAVRPLVFILTDGEPLDIGWETEAVALHSGKGAPNMTAIGLGQVSGATLRTLAGPAGKVHVNAPASTFHDSLKSSFEALTHSVILSASSLPRAVTDAMGSIEPNTDDDDDWL